MNSNNGLTWNKIILSKQEYYTYDIMTCDLNGDGRLDIVENNSGEIWMGTQAGAMYRVQIPKTASGKQFSDNASALPGNHSILPCLPIWTMASTCSS